jgi:hypothetical protein
MLVDAAAVFMMQMDVNIILIEALLLVLAGVNVWLLLQMKKSWKQVPPVEPEL